ncbi:MAG TPA: DUF3298 domain-containing protein [Pyrinomonadaceae bacterium]|jgi:hypothetical protein
MPLVAALYLTGLAACAADQVRVESGSNNAPVSSASSAAQPLNSNREDRTHTITEQENHSELPVPEINLGDDLKIITKELSEENPKLKYRNHVSFPQIEGATNGSLKRFNQAVAAMARKEFEDYRKIQLRPMKPQERFPRYHQDVVEYLSIDYEVMFANTELLSVRFSAETYGRGAAHAVQYFFVLNYDLKSGGTRRLSDLFKSRSRYLDVIASYTLHDLEKRICPPQGRAPDDEALSNCLHNMHVGWWDERLAAKSENYKIWNVAKNGLVISFDECLVAGCAGGQIVVVVPYAEIKDLLKSESPIAALLN